jgi:hypothetical protein
MSVFGSSSGSVFGGSKTGIFNATVEAAGLGDSYIANAVTTGASPALGSRGWMHWGNAYLGAPLRIRADSMRGSAGRTTAQTLAAVGEVTSLQPLPRFCFVSAGNNDVTFDTPTATSVANFQAITAALNAVGVIVVTGPIFARSTSTAGQIALTRAYNLAIQKLATPNSLIWCDWTDLILPSGQAATDVLFDGVHPGSVGARRMGRAIASALGPRIAGMGYALATSGNPGSMTNPLMTGTGGTLNNGFTGTAPDSYSFHRTAAPGSGTAVASKITRTDGFGDFAQLTFSAIVTAGKWQSSIQSAAISYATAGFAEGDLVEAAAEIEVDPGATNLDGPFLQVLDNNGASQITSLFGYFGPTGSPWDEGAWSDITRCVLRVPPFQIRADAGSDSITIRAGISGNGAGSGGITATIRVGRVTLRKV